MFIEVKNNIKEIEKVCDKVQEFCTQNNVSDDKSHDIVLIVDEIIINVINYAYADKNEHVFTLNINKKGSNYVHIKITDNGMAFNPLDAAIPDIESSIEDRRIGGLGIFIAKQLSERIEYSRIDDKNQLEIDVLTSNNGENNGSTNNK
jgi:anti-sigma regulatory factor (Ser/Thr protein kinase)